MSAPTSTDPGGSTGTNGTVGATADAAKQSGQQVAGSAADHAKDVAGTATDKAADVVQEAKSQARDVLGEARTQVASEAETRRGQAVSSLRSIGDELDAMQDHDGENGIATQLVGRGTSYVRQTADWLDGRQPNEILDDVRRFARDRPGTFLLGALIAGVVAGRLTRAVKAGAPDAEPAGVSGSSHQFDSGTVPTVPAAVGSQPFSSSYGEVTTSDGLPPVTDFTSQPLSTDGRL